MNDERNYPLIYTEALTKTYKVGSNQVTALCGIDLSIYQGEFVALMGASGSGKSTLLHLLGCLDSPTSGKYLLENQDVSTLSVNQRAFLRNRHIGFVFQSFNLLPQMTALNNVALPLQYRQQVNDSQTRAMEVLKRVGLAERIHHLPNELSGGECQRVAIARALVVDPGILLADEPTGNLDSHTGTEIMKLLVELSEEGRSIFMVTHDWQLARFAHRCLFMRDGQFVKSIDDYPSAHFTRRQYECN
ncbi:MAG TPA: ABC transporter ATP-binding protein [Anaerolineales bacterium]|nr:ABC transporter ATP-binding protein [Anaerolineales bacterium]